MTQRTCLLIDDSKQDDILPTIMREGKKHGIEINCLQFNVGHPELKDVLTNEQIDLDKVITVFKETYRNQKIDIIAFDWDLSSDNVNGPSIIKAFNDHDIRRKIPKILYSGILKEEIEKLCGKYRSNIGMPFKEIWNQINALISPGIMAFVSRDNYEITIVEHLRKVKDTIETSIDSVLMTFPDLKFQNRFVSDQFKDRNFGDIASTLQKDENLKEKFTKEITEQIIAYLTERI